MHSKGRRKKRQSQHSAPVADAGFLSPTRSYQTRLAEQAQKSKRTTKQAVDGVPRFGPDAPHHKRDPVPGVGSYSPVDKDSIAAKAQAATEAGRRRAAPTSPRTRTITADDEARRALAGGVAGRSQWARDNAGAGATVPLRLGHERGLAGNKPIITGRCTFNG